MRVVGIDPGVTGACCLFVEGASGPRPQFLDFLDMPMIGEDARRHVNETELLAWLVETQPDLVAIELVGAMPSIPDKKTGERRSMGSASAFHFGDTCATIRTTVRLGKWPMIYITPAKWKKFYGLKGSDKEPSRQRALQLVPDASPFLARRLDHARAEALLLARYAGMIERSIREEPVKPREPEPNDEIPE